MFKVKLETGNAAFDGDDKPVEIARILRQIAERVENGQKSGPIHDINGNRVGRYDTSDKD